MHGGAGIPARKQHRTTALDKRASGKRQTGTIVSLYKNRLAYQPRQRDRLLQAVLTSRRVEI